MGVLAALITAVGWAFAGAMVAARSARVDAITQAALRSSFAWLFVVVALFVLGAQSDVWHMRSGDLWQVIVAGLVGLAIGEACYTFSISLLGLTRAFTSVIGLYSLMAFVLPAIFLGDAVDWDQAAGAVLIVIGVYMVAIYGRPRQPATATAPHSGRFQLWRRTSRKEREDPAIRGGSGAKIEIVAPPAAVRIPFTDLTSPRVLVGTVVALGAGLAWAADATWLRSIAVDYDAAAIAAVHIPVAALVLLLYAGLLSGSAIRRRILTGREVTLIGFSGVISVGIGSILFVFAIQEIGTGPASVLFATSPIFALPLGVIFLHERITRWGIGGAAIAVGGIALLS